MARRFPDPPDGPSGRDGQDPPSRSLGDLRERLADGDELAALVYLCDGDPLEVSPRAHDWLMENGYVLDRRKLAIRATTHLASELHEREADLPLDRWIGEALERVALVLLEEDAEAERRGDVIEEPIEPRFARILATMRVDQANVRKVCRLINGRPADERRAVYNCLFLKKGFGRYAREIGGDPEDVRAAFIRGVNEVLAQLADDGERGGPE